MKLLSGLLLAASLAAAPAFAGTIVAPGTPGDAQGPTPLNYYGTGGSQVQQIYSSTFFSGPTELSAISFRAYPGGAPGPFSSGTVNVSNLIIQASTTAVSANESFGLQPSTTFAANLGVDPVTVFSGAISLTTMATSSGAQPFDYTINFSTPYLYDPSAGNLLLDFTIPGGAKVSGNGFGFLTFDTVNDNDDGVRSIVNINGSGASGTLSTASAISQFTTSPVAGGVPEPASWALMISGFGLAGVALRRRRALPVRA